MRRIINKFKFALLYFSLSVLFIITGFLVANSFTSRVKTNINYKDIDFDNKEFIDPYFINTKSYYVGGVKGKDINSSIFFQIENLKLSLFESNNKIEPSQKDIYKGGLRDSDLILVARDLIKKEFIEKTEEKFQGLEVDKILLEEHSEYQLVKSSIKVGKVSVFMSNCSFLNSLDLLYSPFNKSYKIANKDEFVLNLCKKYLPPQNAVNAECLDCTYFPVDKNHRLDENYSLEIVAADPVPGGQRVAKVIYKDLVDLFNNAKSAGHNMRITSGYRSYSDQQEVFEAWVRYEMGFGKSRQQAESDANSYSALPGFSEHQLGTTVDLSSLDCIGIETRCVANEKFWEWLKQNAYKYGFVMSYPPGRDNDTGYIYEPWHYRWIGIELSKEFQDNYANRSYLAEFLRNKELY